MNWIWGGRYVRSWVTLFIEAGIFSELLSFDRAFARYFSILFIFFFFVASGLKFVGILITLFFFIQLIFVTRFSRFISSQWKIFHREFNVITQRL